MFFALYAAKILCSIFRSKSKEMVGWVLEFYAVAATKALSPFLL